MLEDIRLVAGASEWEGDCGENHLISMPSTLLFAYISRQLVNLHMWFQLSGCVDSF